MRIAHCSDLHLLSLDGAGVLDFANKRWIGGLNLLTNRAKHYQAEIFEAMVTDINALGVDQVICTGDITNLAFEGEFRFALEHFDKLELDREHVTVLPGNHDAYVAKGAEHYLDIFADHYAPDADWRIDAAPADIWPIVRVRGNVAIIGISTSLATGWFTAYGRVGDEQLARLRSILTDPRLEGLMRLVAIHHPPAGARAKSWGRGLRDHDAFARVIRDAGAELIIHGHEHRDMTEELAGPNGAFIKVRGVQSGTYDHNKPDRTARYRIYDVHSTGPGTKPHATYTMRVWDRSQQCFVADEEVPGVAAATA
jgi:3',5'-cyclic AMP phosphodiesterase CpdA